MASMDRTEYPLAYRVAKRFFDLASALKRWAKLLLLAGMLAGAAFWFYPFSDGRSALDALGAIEARVAAGASGDMTCPDALGEATCFEAGSYIVAVRPGASAVFVSAWGRPIELLRRVDGAGRNGWVRDGAWTEELPELLAALAVRLAPATDGSR